MYHVRHMYVIPSKLCWQGSSNVFSMLKQSFKCSVLNICIIWQRYLNKKFPKTIKYFPHIVKKNSYFLQWNFDWKSCFVVFFHEWNEWKNPQFNFSSQNLSIERNFFKWDGKETKILHLLFHRIWKKACM